MPTDHSPLTDPASRRSTTSRILLGGAVASALLASLVTTTASATAAPLAAQARAGQTATAYSDTPYDSATSPAAKPTVSRHVTPRGAKRAGPSPRGQRAPRFLQR